MTEEQCRQVDHFREATGIRITRPPESKLEARDLYARFFERWTWDADWDADELWRRCLSATGYRETPRGNDRYQFGVAPAVAPVRP